MTDDEKAAADPSASTIALALPFGPVVGILLGLLIDNLALGIAIGMPVALMAGVLLGAVRAGRTGDSSSEGDHDDGAPGESAPSV